METRRLSEVISDIREMTREDLHLTAMAMESWHEKTGADVTEKVVWETFVASLPTSVQNVFLSIYQLDEEVRKSARDRMINEGKKEEKVRELSSEEVNKSWAELCKKERNDISINKKDLDEVYSKMAYLSEILTKYLSHYKNRDNLAENVGHVVKLNEYLTHSFNLENLFVQKTEQQEETLKTLKEIEDDIVKQYNAKEIDAITKAKLLSPVSKAQGEIEEEIQKPYRESYERMVKSVKGVSENIVIYDKAIVESLIAKADKIIPIIGDRRTLLNQIKNHKQSNAFNKDQACDLIGELYKVAIDRRQSDLAALCKQAIIDIDPSKVEKFNIATEIKPKSSLMISFFKQKKEPEIKKESPSVPLSKKPSKRNSFE